MTTPAFQVLVVDDDRFVRHALSLRLEAEGFAVRSAAHGEDALLACTSPLPDVIILDICLPGIDGYQVCERIRQKLQNPVVVIFLTGTTRAGTATSLEQLVQQSGGDYFLAKPYDAEVVIQLIHKIAADKLALQTTY
jgi:CheY-like chemotaxis protein